MPSSVINSDDGVISGTSGLKSSGGDDGVLVFQSKGTETARINTDKQIVAAAGTASLPALTTTGDVNTGIFFPAADTIAFAEGGAEAMRITSDGNVGIGLTPSQRLQIAQAVAIEFDMFVGATRTLTLYGDATQTIIANPTAVPMIFRTSDTERARIDSSGNLLVGTTSQIIGTHTHSLGVSAPGTNTPISTLVNATVTRFAIDFHNPNGRVGSVTTLNSNTSYNTSSDYRLKENIAPMTGALAKVAQLKPCTWSWKVDGSGGQGFVAHELQEVIPECVTGTKDETSVYIDEEGNEQTSPLYQGVDTSFLVATLTAAIQELKTELDEAKARIAALEAVPGNE